MMWQNTVNDRDQDHQKGKDTTEVTHNVGKVHLTMMLKNAVNNQDQDHQKKNIQEKSLMMWEKFI